MAFQLAACAEMLWRDNDAFYNACNERLPQYETEAVLRQRIEALPSVDLHADWRATDLSRSETAATVRATDGVAERVFQAEFVVGCDGSHSTEEE